MIRTWPLVSATVPERPVEDVVLYRLLAEHPDLVGVSVELADEPSARTPPWVRVAVTRHLERPRSGETTPVAALDVFTEDGLSAAELASTITALWPTLSRIQVPGEAFVSGAWVELEPFRLPASDTSAAGADLARFHLEVGLRIHPPLTSGA